MADSSRGRLVGLRPRGEPARQPHGALPLEGDRRADGATGRERHAGQDAGGAGLRGGLWPAQDLVAIKAPVFSMAKLDRRGHLPGAGDEVDRRGHGHRQDVPGGAGEGAALRRADAAPASGGVLLSIADKNKAESLPIIRELAQARFRLYATEGTADMIRGLGMEVEEVTKRISEGHPERRRRHPGAEGRLRHQHAGRRRPVRHARRLPDPARRRREPHPLLHVAGHGAGGRASAPPGEPPSPSGAGQAYAVQPLRLYLRPTPTDPRKDAPAG